MFWWGLLALAVATVIFVAALLRWMLTDPDRDHEIAKDSFQAEQDFRALRRSGKL
ncbi:MAG TPA: hypothetical protein VFN26_20170 [Candidatus Acidoferrum sp.]|nr:hypothetical protein [Candidatus Acidoferrum sp.]